MIKCHHVDGTCKNGCEPGFIGDKCKTGAPKMLPNKLYFILFYRDTHFSKVVL